MAFFSRPCTMFWLFSTPMPIFQQPPKTVGIETVSLILYTEIKAHPCSNWIGVANSSVSVIFSVAVRSWPGFHLLMRSHSPRCFDGVSCSHASSHNDHLTWFQRSNHQGHLWSFYLFLQQRSVVCLSPEKFLANVARSILPRSCLCPTADDWEAVVKPQFNCLLVQSGYTSAALSNLLHTDGCLKGTSKRALWRGFKPDVNPCGTNHTDIVYH